MHTTHNNGKIIKHELIATPKKEFFCWKQRPVLLMEKLRKACKQQKEAKGMNKWERVAIYANTLSAFKLLFWCTLVAAKVSYTYFPCKVLFIYKYCL